MSTFSLPLNFQTQQTAPQNPIDPFARPAAPVEQTTTQSSVSESTAESASQKISFALIVELQQTETSALIVEQK